MDKNNKKIGLALSGGGYRAAAYHVGTLRALHKLGILDYVDVISSVSGGSIASAYYLLHKNDFENFDKSFSKKLGWGVMHLAFLNVSVVIALLIWIGYYFEGWALLAIIPLWFLCYQIFPLSTLVNWQYKWLFFGKKTLSDLPDMPQVVINTTDVAQACLFKFSKNRAWGYNYHNYQTNEDYIRGDHFSISKAVMASSCVPFAFTPIRIPSKYQNNKTSKMPLLVDGGLYDNQGVHELSEYGEYTADFIIVSNAGNTDINDKRIWNIFKMLVKTSNILMKRIEKMQSRYNMFLTKNENRRYAYVNLNYDANDRLVKGFVRNIAENHVPEEVYSKHNITRKEAEDFKQEYHLYHNINEETEKDFMNRVKKSIKWNELEEICPSSKEVDIARKVSTNLVGLSKKKRMALAKFSEWMTMVQIRMYLPNIIP